MGDNVDETDTSSKESAPVEQPPHEQHREHKQHKTRRATARRTEHATTRRSPPDETPAVFSQGFLRVITIILGVLLIGSAYFLGYAVGRIGAGPAQQATAPTVNVQTPTQQAAAPAQPAAAAPSVTKADKPTVELFVMSYCPYGLQMEKALVPVAQLLAGKADISVKWVDYSMHGEQEVQENLRQYCIQKDQGGKYWNYLSCFVASENTTQCQQQAGIDSAELQTCYNAADQQFGIMAGYNNQASWLNGQFPQFNIDKTLNDQYGVQGSPTLVINGQQAEVARSADAVKTAICNAFTNPPTQCQTTLSTSAEQPGPGPIGAGGGAGAGTAAAGCGS